MGQTADGFPYPELTDPPDGPAALLNIANFLDGIFGTGVGAWTAYTPTVAQQTVVSINTGTMRCRYWRVGRLVNATFYVPLTSAGTAGQPLTCSVPVTAAVAEDIRGAAEVYDQSTNTHYSGTVSPVSTTTFAIQGYGTTGTWGFAPSIAVASGDFIRGHLTYEAAS